jgi:antirestriction protein ArdC
MHISAVYESVTNSIIADLEKGVASWAQPWSGGGVGALPTNAATSRNYSGINIPILWRAGLSKGYPSHGWMTFKQAQGLGATVRAGEKGTHVVFTKKLTVREEDEEKQIAMLRTYTVFNVAQIDGLQPSQDSERPEPETRQDGVTAFIAATKADIRIGGDRACYVPALDFICLPPEAAFKSREHFLATALHECGHWSGHKSRLDRDLKSGFNEKAYAAEELIALS